MQRIVNTAQWRITLRGCLQLLNCGILLLLQIWMVILSILSVSWWPFIFNQKCACCFSDFHLSLKRWHFIVVRREGKINDQLWEYSVINRLPFISELSTIHYWKCIYWLICPDLNKVDTLLVRELDLAQNARCLWKFGIFVLSIAYHWYFENDSSIIP